MTQQKRKKTKITEIELIKFPRRLTFILFKLFK